MRKLSITSLLLLSLSLNSCQAIAGIFKAGMWVGVLIVVAIIGLLLAIVSKVGGK